MVYVIPRNCPEEKLFLVSGAWEDGAIRQASFEALFPPEALGASHTHKPLWTCSGCTVGLARFELDCRARQCGMGGKPLAGV